MDSSNHAPIGLLLVVAFWLRARRPCPSAPTAALLGLGSQLNIAIAAIEARRRAGWGATGGGATHVLAAGSRRRDKPAETATPWMRSSSHNMQARGASWLDFTTAVQSTAVPHGAMVTSLRDAATAIHSRQVQRAGHLGPLSYPTRACPRYAGNLFI